MQKRNLVLGIDIGGTNIKHGLVSADGKIIKSGSISTQKWVSSDSFVEQLNNLIKKYEEEDGIVGCGIAIPATVDNTGHILFVPAIPCLQGLCLQKNIQEQFPHLTIVVENDANAAAYGEYQLHTSKIENGMFLITLGTGVGCGLIYNDKTFKGGNGNALELGEILSEKNERLEDLIGVQGLMKMANMKTEGEILTVRDIVRMANEKDAFAVGVMHNLGRTLGRAIVHLGWLFDVWNFVLGGGISEAFTSINEGLQDYMDEVLPESIRKMTKVEKAVLGNDAGVVGIALHCFNER